MGRPHRVQIAGGTYHVTSRGNRHQSIYHDDDDRKLFLALRDQVVQKCGWRTLAHCLMTNHFHLLIETPAPNLSVGMHRLNSDYARYFNERHSFEGHLFERRFSSRLVETEGHLTKALRYIAFNPVEAGLCVHPWDWRWSSFYGVEESFVFDLSPRPGVRVRCQAPHTAGLAEAVEAGEALAEQPDKQRGR